MQGVYEQLTANGQSTSHNNHTFSTLTGLPASYLGYISSYSGNQDYLNSSQNEKTWLNSSLNEKNWLNNSLSLPPEQRYQSLNEMVAKIIEEENQKSLFASSNNLNFSFKAIAAHQKIPQTSVNYPTNSIPFYRQDSRKSLNESFNQNLIPAQYLAQFSQNSIGSNDKIAPQKIIENHLNSSKVNQNGSNENIPNHSVNQQNQSFVYTKPLPNYPIIFPGNQQMFINTDIPGNIYWLNKMSPDHINTGSNYAISPLFNKNPGQYLENTSTTFLPFDPVNQMMNYQTSYQINQNDIPSGNMSLAFPSSYSHHLATLSVDQRNYLLQQQQQLVLNLTANEQYLHARNMMMNRQSPKISSIDQDLNKINDESILLNKPNVIDQNEKLLKNNIPKIQIMQPTIPLSPTSSNQNFIRTQSSTSSNSSMNSPTYAKPQNFKSDALIESGPNKVMIPFMSPVNFNNIENRKSNIQPQINTNLNSNNRIYQSNLLQDAGSIFSNNNILVKDITRNRTNEFTDLQSDLNDQSSEKQSRTGPANELHVRLEECLHEFKSLEVERKKIESELAYLNMSRKQQFTNTSINIIIPRLSSNPSRVDRLIVESLREYSKTLAFISKIENLTDTIFFSNIQTVFKKWYESIQNLQVKRKDELLNNANKQRMGLTNRTADDKDVIILANAIKYLSNLTRKARTSLWCAFQISNVNYKNPIILTKDLRQNESLFNSLSKTKEFVQKTFQIKTDLFELNQINHKNDSQI